MATIKVKDMVNEFSQFIGREGFQNELRSVMRGFYKDAKQKEDFAKTDDNISLAAWRIYKKDGFLNGEIEYLRKEVHRECCAAAGFDCNDRDVWGVLC